MLAALLVAQPAEASLKGGLVFGGTGTDGGQFSVPSDIAVYVGTDGDSSTDKVLVADEDNRRIQRLSPAGVFERAWGQDVVETGGSGDTAGDRGEICVVAAQCQAPPTPCDDSFSACPDDAPGTNGGEFVRPTGIAVNQVTGEVFVFDSRNARVQQFDLDGNFVRAWGWNVVEPGGAGDTVGAGFEVCTVAEDCRDGVTGTGDGQFASVVPFVSPEFHLNGIAVQPGTGDVLVADPGQLSNSERRVQRFSASGTYLSSFGDSSVFAAQHPADVAVDSDGVVYATDTDDVKRYDLDLPGFLSPFGAGATTGMEVDPDSDGGGADEERLFRVLYGGEGIEEYDLTGPAPALTETHVPDWDVPVRGIGSAVTQDKLYVSVFGANRIVVLDEVGSPPAIMFVNAPSGVGAHEVTLSGSVNPNGVGVPVSYRWELSEDGVDWEAVTTGTDLGDGTTPIPVSDVVSGLEANTFYHARLVTTKAYGNDPAASAVVTFMTPAVPPEVETGAAQQVTFSSARVRGRINPNNLPTTYRVEYGLTASYGQSTADLDAGAGGVEKLFVTQLSGLAPDTTYHYRYVATNAEGTVDGVDRTFTTRPSGPPSPGGRVYEMVTPPDKSSRRGGGSAPFDLPLVGVPSADGESLFSMLRFAVLDSGAGSSVPHSFDLFVLRRSPSGWNAEAVNDIAPQEPSVAGLLNAAGLSADLEAQAWQHNEWLFPSGSSLGTKVFGDSGGLNGSGWYDWVGEPAVDEWSSPTNTFSRDVALLGDQHERMLRWGGPAATYRGLLGTTSAADPSRTQLAGEAGGDAVYLQAPIGSGPKDLVNECTGTTSGGDATEILARSNNGTPANFTDDLVSAFACQAGSVTSKRGAAGGGGLVSGPVGGPVRNAMSVDGARAFFTSPDPNAPGVPTTCSNGSGGASDCPPQLFVRQYDSSGVPTVRWVSRSQVPGQHILKVGRGVGYEGSSADGRVVYFRTNAPLTPDDPDAGAAATAPASDLSWDLYRYELPADRDDDPAGGTLTRVSGGPDDGDPDSDAGDFDPNVLNPATAGGTLRFLSDDGQRAYFVTRGIIGSPGDAWNQVRGNQNDGPIGVPSTDGTRNLYLFDATRSGNDRWRFVARLPYDDNGSELDACASHVARSGMPGSEGGSGDDRTPVNCVHGTSDGSAVVFETQGTLTSDDDDSAGDIYLYEADADSLTRVSAPLDDSSDYACSPSERCNATLGRTLPFSYEAVGLNGVQNQNLAVRGGAVSVFFEARTAYVEEDVNNATDVYEWRGGELSLITPGDGEAGYFSGNTEDGEDVFFSTAAAIDPREIDEDFDIYDARIGGGIPLPADPGPQCDTLADNCQGGGGTPVEVDRQNGSGGDVTLPPRISLSVRGLNAKSRKRAARSGVIALRVRSSAAGTARAIARASWGGKSRRVGATRKRMAAGRVATLRIKLSPAARKRLRSGKILRIAVVIRLGDAKPRSLSVRLERGRR